MARTARYVRDTKGFGAYMMSGDVADFAEKVTDDVRAVAYATAPESTPKEKGSSDGTRYKDRFSTHAIVVTIKGKPRRAGELRNDSEYAVKTEFGFGPNSRPQGGTHGTGNRTMGRAAAQFGDFRGGPE